jgi:hypothetical protein
MGLALITRIPNLMEAQIAAGALRSAGIAAEVFDQGFGAMEAPVIESLGGYRLMAPEAEVALARETLRVIRANPIPRDPEDALEPWAAPATSSAWKRKGMRIVAFLFLTAPLILVLVARLLSRP